MVNAVGLSVSTSLFLITPPFSMVPGAWTSLNASYHLVLIICHTGLWRMDFLPLQKFYLEHLGVKIEQ
jgi:hypothetical protein